MQNSKELQLGPPFSSRGAWESLEVLPLPVAQIPCKMLVVRGPCLGECVSKITIWPIWGIYVKILAKRGTVLTRNRRKLLPRPDEKIIRLPETMFFFLEGWQTLDPSQDKILPVIHLHPVSFSKYFQWSCLDLLVFFGKLDSNLALKNVKEH